MKQDQNTIDWPIFAAWVVALGATGGALFIGEVLGQLPCDLCWFQRTFMFPLAVILGISVLRGDPSIRVYGLALAGRPRMRVSGGDAPSVVVAAAHVAARRSKDKVIQG